MYVIMYVVIIILMRWYGSVTVIHKVQNDMQSLVTFHGAVESDNHFHLSMNFVCRTCVGGKG